MPDATTHCTVCGDPADRLPSGRRRRSRRAMPTSQFQNGVCWPCVRAARSCGAVRARRVEPEVGNEKKGVTLLAEEYAVKASLFPERVARVVGKTFSVIGSDAFDRGLADDQAIAMIKDLLDEMDQHLIERNKNKSIARLKRAS